jgi:hypothetical protein
MNGVFLDTVGLIVVWDATDQLRITRAFTNDAHFHAAGFEALF